MTGSVSCNLMAFERNVLCCLNEESYHLHCYWTSVKVLADTVYRSLNSAVFIVERGNISLTVFLFKPLCAGWININSDLCNCNHRMSMYFQIKGESKPRSGENL